MSFPGIGVNAAITPRQWILNEGCGYSISADEWRRSMNDLKYLAVIVGFFIVCALYAKFSEGL